MLERFREIAQDLQLSDEQKQKVQQIAEDARTEFGSMAQELRTMDPQERGQKLRELTNGVRDQIRQVLNPDQKATFDEKVQELRGQLQQRFGGGDGATTQPGSAPGEGPGQMLLRRFQEGVAKLELTDDQKTKVKSILDDASTKMQELRAKVASGASRDELREQGRQIATDLREKLTGVLTPEQRAKLRESMQGALGGSAASGPAGGRGFRGRGNREGASSATKSSTGDVNAPEEKKDSMDGSDKKSGESPRGSAADQAASQVAEVAPPPDVGSPAAQFSLEKLDGRNIQLSLFKGKVLVIEFGSYSSPSFRQRVAPMQQLSHETGNRAQFLIVYTTEAHPSDGWQVDRNRDDSISIPQHKSLADRKAAARDARERLHIQFPIASDDMDNSVAKAYGAGENSAVVIGRDGNIAAFQRWTDPSGLRRIIDEAAAASANAGTPVQSARE
jgi:Spy/CpxP family protein refolding chaperone/peroxiredoxin